jgi:hypothetical protein
MFIDGIMVFLYYRIAGMWSKIHTEANTRRKPKELSKM